MMRGRTFGLVSILAAVVLFVGSVSAGMSAGIAADEDRAGVTVWPFAIGIAVALLLLVVGVAKAGRRAPADEGGSQPPARSTSPV